MTSDEGLIRAAARQMAQQAAMAMERATTHGQRAVARQLIRAAAWWPVGSERHSPLVIQEIIRSVFAVHPDQAFRTKDLCAILHPGLPTRAHIAKTNHEARQVVASDTGWTCELSADRREVVFFNRASERSKEIAAEMLAPKLKRPSMRRPPRSRRKAAPEIPLYTREPQRQ